MMWAFIILVLFCIYGAYSGTPCLDFRHLYSSTSLLRVVWMDRFMSVKLQKVVDVVLGYISYRSNAMCIQCPDQMTMVLPKAA